MATKIPEETQLTSFKCWSKLGTGLLTSKQKLADLPFMLVSHDIVYQWWKCSPLAWDCPFAGQRHANSCDFCSPHGFVHSFTDSSPCFPFEGASIPLFLLQAFSSHSRVSSSCRFSALPSIQPRDYRYLRARFLVFRPLDEAESRS